MAKQWKLVVQVSQGMPAILWEEGTIIFRCGADLRDPLVQVLPSVILEMSCFSVRQMF